MKVYLAHPYGGDRENIEKAGMLARVLKEAHPDWIIFSPLHNFAWVTYDETKREEQMKNCLTMLEACDGVYFAKGWEYSLGCVVEMVWTIKKKKPFTIEEEEGKRMNRNGDRKDAIYNLGLLLEQACHWRMLLEEAAEQGESARRLRMYSEATGHFLKAAKDQQEEIDRMILEETGEMEEMEADDEEE